ncbi:23S rRNA (uracil(1939)-C(5))-methyltransferase RlmD [Candidatus Poribacteria bacterium]|nr:23S rRNA (uracil(1939)-C(5))-methyltransferase RlmD [Candidatus Poribacteria bacterium]
MEKFRTTLSIRKFFDKLKSDYQKVDPRCAHFNECGGCSLQDISYEDQLDLKERFLRELFDGQFELESQIHLSPQPFYYRHRMDYTCAFSHIGLRKRDDYTEVIDLNECHLLSPRAVELLMFIKRRVKELEIQDYNFLEHAGFLRYVVLREAKFTNDLMVAFTAASPVSDHQHDRLLQLMEDTLEKALSVYWLKHEWVNDHFYGETVKYLGKPHIIEKLGTYQFIIKPDTFFQSNPFLIRKAYDDIKEHVYGRALDLYCGTGIIAIYVSDVCKHVIGVELVNASIEAAKENARLNGVENVLFYADDVAEFLKGKHRFDVMVIDPPRSGMSKNIIRHIKRIAPKRIVYMSCNPVTQFDDLKRLYDDYKLERPIRAYDMFPQTYHLETLAILSRR